MSKLEDLESNEIDKPKKKEENILLNFFLGLILLAAGIFLVFQNTRVMASWHVWRVGGIGVPSGAVAVPLLIGIGMLFYNAKSIIGWLLTIIGVVLLLVSIIFSIKIVFTTTSLFIYVLMFGAILAGTGLLLKALFTKSQ